MPKRKVPRYLDEDWRQRISAGQLLQRLRENSLAAEEIMTPGQIRSAEILLKKVLPDLKSVEHVDADGNALPLVQIQFLAAPERPQEKTIEQPGTQVPEIRENNATEQEASLRGTNSALPSLDEVQEGENAFERLLEDRSEKD